jgi:hypothetical protein
MSSQISYYSLAQMFMQCEDQIEKSFFLKQNKENCLVNLNIDIGVKKRNYEGKKTSVNKFNTKLLKFDKFININFL